MTEVGEEWQMWTTGNQPLALFDLIDLDFFEGPKPVAKWCKSSENLFSFAQPFRLFST